MLYAVLLTLHSWWRWVVIITLLVTLVRSIKGATADSTWSETDRRWARFTVGAMDLQFLVGVIMLFFVSPITTTALHAMGEAMHDKTLRFFTVEHSTTMVLAVSAAHIGLVKAKKATGGRAHKRLAIGLGIAVICIAVGVPWSFLSYGRPLFRL